MKNNLLEKNILKKKYVIFVSINNYNKSTNIDIIDNIDKINNHKIKLIIIIPDLYKFIAQNILREVSQKKKGNCKFTNIQKRMNVLIPVLRKYKIKKIIHLIS